MSQKNRVKLTCSNCENIFEATLFRTIWGEQKENRDLVMNDLINVIECPSCHTKTKVEYALMYNDPTILCGVWWEPYPENEIDQCVAGWSKMFGKGNYMVQAPRIKDWNVFKETIKKFYAVELKGSPPVQLRQQQRRKIKIPKLTKKQIMIILGILILLASLSLVIASLSQIKKLNRRISYLEQEINSSSQDYPSEIDRIKRRINDCESQLSDLDGSVNDLQDYSHTHY